MRVHEKTSATTTAKTTAPAKQNKQYANDIVVFLIYDTNLTFITQ